MALGCQRRPRKCSGAAYAVHCVLWHQFSDPLQSGFASSWLGLPVTGEGWARERTRRMGQIRVRAAAWQQGKELRGRARRRTMHHLRKIRYCQAAAGRHMGFAKATASCRAEACITLAGYTEACRVVSGIALGGWAPQALSMCIVGLPVDERVSCVVVSPVCVVYALCLRCRCTHDE